MNPMKKFFFEDSPIPHTLPSFYWDVFSNEQRIKYICAYLSQIANYQDVVTLSVNELSTNVETTVENLNNEIDRAVTAENLIVENLNDEIERATTRENNIETTLTTAINAENERAIAAENIINENLNAEIERATNAENTISANLNAETERATNAENTISDNLNAEIERATDSENFITENLQAEITRATNRESELNNAIIANADDIANIWATARQYAQLIATLQTDVATNTTNIADIYSSISTINDTLTEHNNSISANNDAIEDINLWITGASLRILANEQNIATLQTQVEQNTSDIAALNARIDSVRDTLDDEIATVQASVLAEQNRATLYEQILNDKITALENRVDALEGE